MRLPLVSFCVWLLLLSSPCDANVVSQSAARLPMSLSTVITDLEAEGVAKLNTATILFSRSVRRVDRARLLRSLFDDDFVEDEDGGEATAFAKKFWEDDDASIDVDDDQKLGLAIASPSGGAAAGETALSVLATHGTVVYVCQRVDLERNEGLFQQGLAPAVERLLERQQQQSGEEDGVGVGTNNKHKLVVIFEGVPADGLARAKAKFRSAANAMLSTIVQSGNGEGNSMVDELEDVFQQGVEYLNDDPESSSVYETLMTSLMGNDAALLEPYEAAASVASAVAGGGDSSPCKTKALSVADLAAFQKLRPVVTDALATAVRQVRSVVEDASDDGAVKLVPKFGDLVDAAVGQALATYDQAVAHASPRLRSSPVAKRLRADLVERVSLEISDACHADQLLQHEAACFASFQSGMSTLKISPNLPADMEAVVQTSLAEFKTTAQRLTPSACDVMTTPPSGPFRRRLREYCTDRLQKARVSGNYRPAPRKGVTLGFHWLLPKPFGNDYRQNPVDIDRGHQLFYDKSPTTREVDPQQVRSGDGDWRRKIVPVPAGSEMMFQPPEQ